VFILKLLGLDAKRDSERKHSLRKSFEQPNLREGNRRLRTQVTIERKIYKITQCDRSLLWRDKLLKLSQ